MAKKAGASATIEETLSSLGVDKSLPPEQVAIGQVDEDEDDTNVEVAPIPAAAKTSGVSGLRDNMLDSIRQVKDALHTPPAESETGLESAFAAASEPAMFSPMVAPPARNKVKGPKAVAPAISPGAKKLGALASKLPGAERVKVHKRLDSGQLGHVGDYSIRDLAASPDIESFLTLYVKPRWGAGEYKLTGVDAYNREVDVGSVTLLDPPKQDPASGVFGLVQHMLDKQEQQQKEWMERMNQGAPMAETMFREMRESTREARNEQQSTMTAVIASQGQQMQAFMQMMAQQQQQTMQVMMGMMSQPKTDPALAAVLAKLAEKSSSEPMMAPPPMPPPVNPFEGLKEIVAVIAAMQSGGGNELKDMVKDLLKSREQERLTPRDVIQLMTDLKGSKPETSGTDEFRKAVENLGLMMNVAQNLRQGEQPGAAAGFFDALAALFANRDFAGSIANSIRSRVETAARQQEIQARTALVQQQRAALAEMNRTGMRAPMPPQMPSTLAPPPMQAPAQVAPPVAQQPIPATPVAAPAPAPAQAAEPKVAKVTPLKPKPVLRLPPLPVNAPEHINNILGAKDEGERVGRVVQLFIYLHGFEEWEPIVAELISLVQHGDKKGALGALQSIFGGFVAVGLLVQPVADQIVQDFDKHFDLIAQGLADLPSQDDDGGVDELLAGDEDEEDVDDAEDEDEDAEDEDESDEDDEGAAAQ